MLLTCGRSDQTVAPTHRSSHWCISRTIRSQRSITFSTSAWLPKCMDASCIMQQQAHATDFWAYVPLSCACSSARRLPCWCNAAPCRHAHASAARGRAGLHACPAPLLSPHRAGMYGNSTKGIGRNLRKCGCWYMGIRHVNLLIISCQSSINLALHALISVNWLGTRHEGLSTFCLAVNNRILLYRWRLM